MSEIANELERYIVENLRSISILKNDVEEKENEKHDLLKNISLKIIEIIDSFERIEEEINERKYDKIKEVKSVVGRFMIIKRQLLGLLQNYGVTKIEFPDNRLIVGLCEVVETETDSNRKSEEIITVVRNGYIRGKQVIRPAQIIAVKN